MKTNGKENCIHVLSMLDVAERRLTIPMLAIVLLSLVHSRLISIGVFFKGVFCLLAQSQSFKTTLAALFFDFKHGRQADVNFDSTEAAIVRTITNKRDSTAIVDDLKPGATKMLRNALMMKLEKVLRLCADDSGGYQRASGTSNATKSSVAHCLVLVTAEEIPLAVYSSLARFLIFVMSRKSVVDKETLTYYQEHHHIYVAFIVDYIRYIATQGVDKYSAALADRFTNERDFLRNSLANKNILIDPRTSDMVTWLFISFDEFLKYALNIEAITDEQLNAHKAESLTLFQNLMIAQAERIGEMDDISRYFKGLRYLLDTKEARLGHLQSRNTGYSTGDSKSAIGFIKKGRVYLKNNIAFQQVAAYHRKYGSEFAISETTLRRMLADNDHIIPKSAKNFVHRLHVNQENYQCIVFEEAVFNALLKGGATDGSDDDSEISGDRGLRQNADNYLGRSD